MEKAYKLEIKLTFILTLIVLVIISAAGYYIHFSMVGNRERSFYLRSLDLLDEIFDDVHEVVDKQDEYDIDDVMSVIEGFKISSFSHVWLLDSDCNILFCSNPRFRDYFYNHPRSLNNELNIQDYGIDSREATIPELIRNTPPRPSRGKGQYRFADEVYYVVYNVIPEEGWILGIAESSSSIFADIYPVRNHILMIGILLALLIPFMSLIATGQVIKPMLERRNQLEHMLDQTEQDYEKLVDNANDIIFTLDMGGRFTFMNKQGFAHLGFTKEEILEKTFPEIVSPDYLEYFVKVFERVLENVPVKNIRCEMLNRSGEAVQLEINMIGVTSGKTVVGCMGIARDITHRSELETMLIESKNKLLAIFDSITDGILIVDRNFRVLAVNEAEAAYVGYSPQKLIGMKCHEVYDNSSEICSGCVVRKTFESGVKQHAQINKGRGRRKDIDVYTFPLRDQDGITRETIVYIKDVSKERRIQEQLIQSERLAAIGEIAASIAHEIRTPLISIGGYAKSILKESDEHTPLREKIYIIVEEVAKLERFLREHLDLIKPMQPIFHQYDVNRLIDETLSIVRSKVASNVVFETSYFNSLPSIKIDVERMEEALVNIIFNSMDAFDRGNNNGIIKISTSLNEGYVIIDIEDNGNGISDEIKADVFMPFFTTKSGRCGLGLPISYRIIKNHNGDLTLDRLSRRGTRFSIKLPVDA